jgi:hypothetical protein
VLLEVGGTARPFSMAKVEHSVNTLSQTERQGSTTTQTPMMLMVLIVEKKMMMMTIGVVRKENVCVSANAQGETLQRMAKARPACAHRWA